MIIKTVTVIREDHPDGKVDINECDMTKDDVICADEKAVKTAIDDFKDNISSQKVDNGFVTLDNGKAKKPKKGKSKK